MRRAIICLCVIVLIAGTRTVAVASVYDYYYTSTIDLSAIGENPATNVSVYFRYDTEAVPEQIRTDLGYARYWVDGNFTVGEDAVTFTDALIIVANNRPHIGGDAFGVTNLVPGTIMSGQIYGFDIYAFSFGLRDSDYASIDNLRPPEGNEVLDNFDWCRNAIWFEGGPNVETIHVDYTVNAVLVPEPATLSLLALGGLALLRKRK